MSFRKDKVFPGAIFKIRDNSTTAFGLRDKTAAPYREWKVEKIYPNYVLCSRMAGDTKIFECFQWVDIKNAWDEEV